MRRRHRETRDRRDHRQFVTVGESLIQGGVFPVAGEADALVPRSECRMERVRLTRGGEVVNERLKG